jgi:hypothetical protein
MKSHILPQNGPLLHDGPPPKSGQMSHILASHFSISHKRPHLTFDNVPIHFAAEYGVLFALQCIADLAARVHEFYRPDICERLRKIMQVFLTLVHTTQC